MMKLRWLGHSCFRVESDGYAIVIDPFAPGSVPGLKDIHEAAQAVLCSHDHFDHNCRDAVQLLPFEGEPPVRVTPLPSFHDCCGGTQRGKNCIHLLEGGGVKIAHLGDLGCMPAPTVLEQLRGLDAVLMPVGGHYTVGPQEAQAIADALSPKVVIPMHYRSAEFGFDVIGPVEDYLALCGKWARYEHDAIEIVPGMEPHTAVLTYGK